MNKTRLKKYARLIARVGANVNPGQDVLITAELDQPEFIEMLATIGVWEKSTLTFLAPAR